MRIVMKQEADAKKKAGVTEEVLEECTVAVGKAMSQSQLDGLEESRRRAAEAHVAAEDHEDMEHKRRLKPHIYGARAKSREPNFGNGYTTGTLPVATSPMESALFDRSLEESMVGSAEESVSAEGPVEQRGLVMVRAIPAGATPADLVAFFDGWDGAAAEAGTGSARAPSGLVRDGERGVHLLLPNGGAADAGAADAGASSAPVLLTAQAFVEFGSSDAADSAVAFRDGRTLQGRALEVFRATEDHMAAVLAEARDKERAAAARRADEARASAELRRQETIAAARAARAAEKERHRQDADNLKLSKAMAAAKEASETEAGGISPYGMGGGKENAPDGRASDDEVNGDKAKAAAHDTKAAIVNVSRDKAEVLAMAPGCGLRPFQFERVFDADARQEHVYELCGRAAVADVLNGHSACVLVYGQTGAGKVHARARCCTLAGVSMRPVAGRSYPKPTTRASLP
jgi:hypothetical protein